MRHPDFSQSARAVATVVRVLGTTAVDAILQESYRAMFLFVFVVCFTSQILTGKFLNNKNANAKKTSNNNKRSNRSSRK